MLYLIKIFSLVSSRKDWSISSQLERLKREVREPDTFLGNLIHIYYTQEGAISPTSELTEAVSYGLIYLVKGRNGNNKQWYLDEVSQSITIALKFRTS